MKITTHSFDLPLQDPFTIARGTVEVQPTLIVKVEQGDFVGLGEATTNDYYNATLETMNAALEKVQPILPSICDLSPDQQWDILDKEFVNDRFALAALDMALNDLWGQKKGEPLWQIWGFDPKTAPVSCYTLGIDEPEVMLRKMQRMPGWPVYKIKLGTNRDLEVVRFLRQHTDARFRVDANCGWTPKQVIPMAEELAKLGVELIEQPLPMDAWDEMKKIRDQSPIPLMADESCRSLDDVDRCADAFHAINIKLVKSGGLTPARRMVERAHQLGLKVMVGCMTESSIGISAACQLLPQLDYADLDGALLLAKDIATGVSWDRGRCQLNRTPGTGAKLNT